MDILARTIADASTHNTGCAVVMIHAGKKLSTAAGQLDKACDGLISSALRSGDLGTGCGDTLLLHSGRKSGARRILLVTAGKPERIDALAARQIINGIVTALGASKSKDATVHLEDLATGKISMSAICESLGNAITTASYRYKRTVSKPKAALVLSKLVINCGKALGTSIATANLLSGQHTGQGINTARELGNLPGNICTPIYLANEARKLARAHSTLSTRVLDEKQMRELGMGSLLSVSAGSAQPAKLIVMQYKGAATEKQPYVLVGKGITFDSGGISLKPGAKMDEMKFDMCGAASVFGTLHAVLAMRLPINLVCIIAAAENMPSSTATKPGDVVTSMSGQTIEVLNTDAEGRLVLCDALTYAERFKPAAVIDIATLTGACVVALGAHASGMYANNDKLAEQLTNAGEQSFDRAWRMPLWDEYQKQINTPFADMANVGGPGGGSITAACFLARFTKKYHWAHLDIAGSAWHSAPKGATGRPVGLLTRYLMDRAGIKLGK
jgi:leucyl aminopeptidase